MKATHEGHCQLCDRLQKLPGEVLAKHGYTTQWGFFSGTCRGSGEPPYEVSRNLIEAEITWQVQARESLLRIADREEKREDGAWVHEYKPATWARGDRNSGFVWRFIYRDEFTVVERESGDYRWVNVSYVSQFTKRPVDAFSGSVAVKSFEAGAAELNKRYATDVRKQADRIGEYLRWLRLRNDRWVSAPEKLVAVEQSA